MAFVTKKNQPPAPGAVASPQIPGEVPDRTDIPGHEQERRVPKATAVRRPLTEYGSAQAIMGVFAAKPGEENNPARFEQATASYEEVRKADPRLLPPPHPLPRYDLNPGQLPPAIGSGAVSDTTQGAATRG